jgi:hypothetical protein
MMAETLEYVSAAIVAAGGRVKGSKGCYVCIWNGQDEEECDGSGIDGRAGGKGQMRD